MGTSLCELMFKPTKNESSFLACCSLLIHFALRKCVYFWCRLCPVWHSHADINSAYTGCKRGAELNFFPVQFGLNHLGTAPQWKDNGSSWFKPLHKGSFRSKAALKHPHLRRYSYRDLIILVTHCMRVVFIFYSIVISCNMLLFMIRIPSWDCALSTVPKSCQWCPFLQSYLQSSHVVASLGGVATNADIQLHKKRGR